MGQEFSSSLDAIRSLKGFTHHMVQHTQFTIDYNSAVVGKLLPAQETAVDGLLKNMDLWKEDFKSYYSMEGDKANEWVVIFKEHILFAKYYIDETHAGNKQLAKKGLDDLFENKIKVVNFFSSLDQFSSSIKWNSIDLAWIEHLECTENYVTVSSENKKGIGNLSDPKNPYILASNNCIKVGYQLGYMLDNIGELTWDEAKERAVFVKERKVRASLVEVTIGKSIEEGGLVTAFGRRSTRKTKEFRGAFYPFTELLKKNFKFFISHTEKFVIDIHGKISKHPQFLKYTLSDESVFHKITSNQFTRDKFILQVTSDKTLIELKEEWQTTFKYYGFHTETIDVKTFGNNIGVAIQNSNLAIANDIYDDVLKSIIGIYGTKPTPFRGFNSEQLADHYISAFVKQNEIDDDIKTIVTKYFKKYNACLYVLADVYVSELFKPSSDESVYVAKKIHCLNLVHEAGDVLDYYALRYQTLPAFNNSSIINAKKNQEKNPSFAALLNESLTIFMDNIKTFVKNINVVIEAKKDDFVIGYVTVDKFHFLTKGKFTVDKFISQVKRDKKLNQLMEKWPKTFKYYLLSTKGLDKVIKEANRMIIITIAEIIINTIEAMYTRMDVFIHPFRKGEFDGIIYYGTEFAKYYTSAIMDKKQSIFWKGTVPSWKGNPDPTDVIRYTESSIPEGSIKYKRCLYELANRYVVNFLRFEDNERGSRQRKVNYESEFNRLNELCIEEIKRIGENLDKYAFKYKELNEITIRSLNNEQQLENCDDRMGLWWGYDDVLNDNDFDFSYGYVCPKPPDEKLTALDVLNPSIFSPSSSSSTKKQRRIKYR